ncbi:sigma-54-dependent Fis family transcriptional regulator [Thiorhodococcus mannitoliphagus]|uniref:Sigma-54-dependent Fis family transcriptional regulator n=1 Tax=Thiorhodococcus mannitoliphagus TaxID=329406 RepID=A0A6P1E441_9GAMM|nr:sigma 54-interacting transcriptional regulator [Thiorhodococcus mannitoliphagus]NEX22445.1 sigma-54-dependent Fis family transcriptional regulator [Thiorhodococcus mannitoliphagus]
MPTMRHLSPEDRSFFALLTETVYANPFGTDQERLSRLLGRAAPSTVSQADLYDKLMPALETRLEALRQRGLERLDQFCAEDQTLMRQVFLFHGYQHHYRLVDGLIEHQRRGRTSAADLSWIPDLLNRLRDYGFDPQESRRWVALYYQLRRAYDFIERALVGRSEPMRTLRRSLWNSAFTTDLRSYTQLLWGRMQDFSTLLLGETGTGKGSAAAAIGRSGAIPLEGPGHRFARGIEETFIATNLSELSEGLIESELFGHRKGAFTGAVDNHDGLFARCDSYGTLFLDEIGDVSLPVQTKLLRVLQERTFTPVGSHKPQRFEGRIVAATNRSLQELMSGSGFRRDFFYRLSGNIICVPTLRERLADSPDELEELVAALLGRMVGEAADALQAGIMEALSELPANYPWPGNVRELEQALRRIILNGCYVPDALPGGHESAADAWILSAEAGSLDAAELLAGYCRQLYEKLGTYEAVARVTGLDRRTAKRHIHG